MILPAWTNTDLIKLPVLSIRQPWANAILCGLKDVENRSMRTAIRGRFLIHASANTQPDTFTNWCQFVKSRGFDLDAINAKVREGGVQYGGIIGSVDIIDCVKNTLSPWYTGQWAYVLKDPQPLEFLHLRGMPGFFKVPALG
jgi:hypothetical protein